MMAYINNTVAIEAPESLLEPLNIKLVDKLPDTIRRLASLSLADYERCRKDESKSLGFRTSALDVMIKKHKQEGDKKTNGNMLFASVEQWHESVDGAALLDEIAAVIEKYIVCEKSTTHAAALWIVFTWCIDAMQVAPIACITAPEKRCGKTQLLNLIGLLCKNPQPASNITPAALYRTIEAYKPTLLIDEADTFLGKNEELRGIINSGHTRQSAFVIRTVGDDHMPVQFSTWGAKAISGIGHLPDTLKDRSILLTLRRKRGDEQRCKLRHTGDDDGVFSTLRRKLARWSADNIDALTKARPESPITLNDRAQDNWEPMLAIADIAGGHWSATSREAAIEISGSDQAVYSTNEQLLANIKQIFEHLHCTRISSRNLIDILCSDDEAPWNTLNRGRPMTLKQLSTKLRDFGFVSRTLRFGDKTAKGYECDAFSDVFSRYLNPEIEYPLLSLVDHSDPF